MRAKKAIFLGRILWLMVGKSFVFSNPKGGEKPESTVADAPVEDVDRRPFFDGGKKIPVFWGVAWPGKIPSKIRPKVDAAIDGRFFEGFPVKYWCIVWVGSTNWWASKKDSHIFPSS